MLRRVKTVLFLLLITVELAGHRPGDLKGFYGSMNLGIGMVHGNITGETFKTTSQFAMQLNVGYFLCRSVQAGITLNGWLFEPFGEIPFAYRGESLSNGMIHLQYYPFSNCRLFLKGAYGLSEYTNLRPLKDNGRGHARMAAAGYEKEIGAKNFLLGIQLSINAGRLEYTNMSGTSGPSEHRFRTVDITVFLGLD